MTEKISGNNVPLPADRTVSKQSEKEAIKQLSATRNIDAVNNILSKPSRNKQVQQSLKKTTTDYTDTKSMSMTTVQTPPKKILLSQLSSNTTTSKKSIELKKPPSSHMMTKPFTVIEKASMIKKPFITKAQPQKIGSPGFNKELNKISKQLKTDLLKKPLLSSTISKQPNIQIQNDDTDFKLKMGQKALSQKTPSQKKLIDISVDSQNQLILQREGVYDIVATICKTDDIIHETTRRKLLNVFDAAANLSHEISKCKERIPMEHYYPRYANTYQSNSRPIVTHYSKTGNYICRAIHQ